MLHLLPPPPPNTTTAPKSKRSYKQCPSLVHSRYCDLAPVSLRDQSPVPCVSGPRTHHAAHYLLEWLGRVLPVPWAGRHCQSGQVRTLRSRNATSPLMVKVRHHSIPLEIEGSLFQHLTS